ncbi:hypothetical protein V1477_020614 [Vespula maculifrons]|uniref:Uncharacterized protein n=1 Tax=Vespula maculifrons TaxID=7453 RepID=A0ABD2AMG2_VESMC
MPGRRPTKHRDFNFNKNTAPLEEEQEWNAARCLYLNQEAKQFESPAIIREFTSEEGDMEEKKKEGGKVWRAREEEKPSIG